MGVVVRDTAAYFKPLGGILSQAIAADTTSNPIDTIETPEDLLVVINAGTCTDGAYQVKILHDDSPNGTFAEALYTSETFEANNDNKIVIASIRNFKRYIKVAVEEVTPGSTGIEIGVAVLGVDKYV